MENKILKRGALSILVGIAGLAATVPARAERAHFVPRLCGVNIRDNFGQTGVNEIYQGVWTRDDGATTDAFLIRYFDGKDEIYLTSDKVWDKVLNIVFYDVYNLNANVTPIYLSFGIDTSNYIVGDTSHGYQFSATLHPTQSATSCSDPVPPPSSGS